MLVVGDYNIPEAQWIENDDSFNFNFTSKKSIMAQYVTDAMTECGLFQMCNIQNTSNNVLDLVYTTVPELLVAELATKRLVPTERSDKAHNPISITLECEPKVYPANHSVEPEPTYCFKKEDDVNVLMDRLYAFTYELFERFVPKASLRNQKTQFGSVKNCAI